MKPGRRLSALIHILAWLSVLCGCSESRPGNGDDYLIRGGDRVVTVSEFYQALEIAKAAYPHNEIQNQEVLESIRLRVLNQLIEEIILFNKAAELGIHISEAELEAAVAAIRQEFPDDTFQQTLLENAISYPYWKKRLKTRLLMEKVIEQDLESEIEISSEDITQYLEEHGGREKLTSSETDQYEDNDADALMIKRLRREKAEKAYLSWISRLQKEYSIEINTDQWRKIVGT